MVQKRFENSPKLFEHDPKTIQKQSKPVRKLSESDPKLSENDRKPSEIVQKRSETDVVAINMISSSRVALGHLLNKARREGDLLKSSTSLKTTEGVRGSCANVDSSSESKQELRMA